MLGRKFWFQQDSDPKHASKLCKGFLQEKTAAKMCKVMVWQPQSLDLSPNELVRDELDRRANSRSPTNSKQLWDILQEEWKNIRHQYLNKIQCQEHRMPRIGLADKVRYFQESEI